MPLGYLTGILYTILNPPTTMGSSACHLQNSQQAFCLNHTNHVSTLWPQQHWRARSMDMVTPSPSSLGSITSPSLSLCLNPGTPQYRWSTFTWRNAALLHLLKDKAGRSIKCRICQDSHIGKGRKINLCPILFWNTLKTLCLNGEDTWETMSSVEVS